MLGDVAAGIAAAVDLKLAPPRIRVSRRTKITQDNNDGQTNPPHDNQREAVYRRDVGSATSDLVDEVNLPVYRYAVRPGRKPSVFSRRSQLVYIGNCHR